MKPGQLQWVVTFSMLLLFHVSAMALPCVTAPSGLIGWWPAETNANDSIGGNNGTLVNGAGFATGEVGQAFSFDGASSYVSIPDSPSLDTFVSSITIEAWIKVNQTTANSNWKGIVTKGNSSWRLQGRAGAKTVVFSATGVSPNGDLYGSRNVNDSQWHHVAGVYDGTNMFLYVDGTLDVSQLATGSIAQNNYPMCVGQTANSSGYFFNGLIDEVSIYNRALTVSEIQSIYAAGSVGKCPLGAPIIISQPTNQTVTVGGTATFNVTTRGTWPMSYQWSFNGTNIVGATNTSLILTNVQFNQAGNYTVLVTNLYGSILSSNVVLVVCAHHFGWNQIPSPQYAGQPFGVTLTALDVFNVTVSNFNGSVSLAAGGGPNRMLDGVVPDQSALGTWTWGYSFTPTNELAVTHVRSYFGTKVSLWTGTGVLLASQNVAGTAGTWTETALGTPVTLAAGSSYVVAAYVPDAVYYWITRSVIGFPNGTINQSLFSRIDTFPTNITTGVWPMVGLRYTVGSIAPISITPTNSGNFVHGVWSGNITVLQPATNINIMLLADDGSGHTGTSNPFDVLSPPVITSQPTNQTVFAGGTATFGVTADGTAPLSYQWNFNGTNVVGATNMTLTLTNVQFTQAGNYAVLVTNVYGLILSSNAVLTVNPIPPCVLVPDGLVGWWPGEGDANDVAGGNNGTLVNGASFAKGIIGQAFSFNGTSSYVSIPDSPSLDAFTNCLTIETWININQLAASSDWRGIVTKGNSSWRLQGTAGAGTLTFSVTGFDPQDLTGSRNVNDGQWHHVAAVYDRTGMYLWMYLYVDGALDVSHRVYGSFSQNNDPICIGANSSAYFFNGLLDDVSIYNRALTASEIQAIYAAGPAGKCPIPLMIIALPTDQTVYVGQKATFKVVASGMLPLSYQWLFNGTNIAGATNTTLTLTNVQLSQAGNYAVLATNAYGSVLSSNAVLTVNPLPPCTPAPSGLAGWWPAEGNANDIVGNNNGTLVNGVTFTNGMVGQAFSFNGTSSYVSIPDSPLLDTFVSSITIEAWIKSNRTNADSNWEGIITKGNSSWRLQATAGSATLTFSATGVSPNVDLYGNRNVYDGQWHHVAGVYNGTNMFLYVDGTLDVSQPAKGSIAQNSDPMCIGANAQAYNPSCECSEPGCFFNGLVDELSIYSRALTTNEIISIYNAEMGGKCPLTLPAIVLQPTNQTGYVGGTTTFNVIASGAKPLNYQWNFNGTNIVRATNTTLTLTNVQFNQAGNYTVLVTNLYGAVLSSNAVLVVEPCFQAPSGLVDLWPGEGNANDVVGTNNGTLINNVGFVKGEVGQAFAFNGTNSYVSIPDSPSLDSFTTSITIETWIKFNQLTVDMNWEGIVAKGNSSWRLQATAGTNTVTFSATGVSPQGDLYGSRNVRDGQWHHVAGVYDGTNMYLYVDGTLDVSQAATGSIAQNSNALGIGKNTGGSGYFFNGMVDEISIYNRALTAIEIQTIYAAGGGGKCYGPVPPIIPPVIISQPTNQTVYVGGTATFNVMAVGSQPLSYQWSFNGTNLVGATNTTLTLTNVQFTQAGNYAVLVTNLYGAVLSSNVVLTVLDVRPAIVSQPTSQTAVVMGSAVSFSVAASGFPPLSYQWYFNGTPIVDGGRLNGCTLATLNISSAQTNDNGSYQVVVTNSYGSVTSAVATLTVYVPVQISMQPASQAVLLSSNAVFTVMATGTAPGYQWYFNGTPISDGGRISGSSTPTLSVSTVQGTDAGGYTAVVTNLLSTATSRMASLTVLTGATTSVRYVNLNNTSPSPPYLDWNTAATNIQDAIDAAVAGDSVIVSNGTYNIGGRAMYGMATNRVTVDKAIIVQSVSGPGATTIVGFRYTPAIRCVYLTNGAALIGFTLTNGATPGTGDIWQEDSGGGIWCEDGSATVSNCVVSRCHADMYGGGAFRGLLLNCILTNNTSAHGGGACSNTLVGCALVKNFASYDYLTCGGGAIYCTLSNCLLVGNSCYGGGGGGSASTFDNCVISNNSARNGGGICLSVANNSLIYGNNANWYGGGADYGTLINCTVVRNSAQSAGGIYGGILTNCVVYYNVSSDNSSNFWADLNTVISYCDTAPLATNGFGNITNEPVFVNLTAGDFHLQSDSPCINAGNNASVTGSADLDGNPRIVGGTVDLGAYECQPLIFITKQPLGQIINQGQNASFGVETTGEPPLSYQWQFNGTNIDGAINSILILTKVQISQSGNYAVLVTNAYGSVLSSNAVLTVNLPPPCTAASSGLMGWWPAEGNANDSIGGNNGALVNGVIFTNGMVGQAFSLNGASSYVSIPDSPSLDTFVSSITIETWIKVNQLTANSNWKGIVTKGNSSWRLQGRAGAKTVTFSATGVSPNGDLYGNRNVNDGQWHHVAGVYDGTNMFLYVDGTLDVSQPATGTILQNSSPLCIGQTAGSSGYFFNGLIDEVSIYNRALTTSEIQAIYAAGSGGKCPLTLPEIISQPTNQTVVVGYTASFSVTANGPLPLRYQWAFNGTNIAGATNTSLTLTNVQLSQAGYYAVLVTNVYGSVLSSNALLIVYTLDHFAWNTIPSPRFVNAPFAVTILAKDATNGTIPCFTGNVGLSSTNGIAVSPLVSGNFVQGIWTGAMIISQTASNLVLRTDDGLGHFGLANPINVISPPQLGILRSNNIASFLWPTGYSGFVLETTANLLPATWVTVPYSPIQIGDQYLLQLDMTGTNGFYRLRLSGP
ncbi:MAG: LamG-like jellyroll fold domain-containing protein [Verrucomicrobiota bacterium]